MSSETQAANPHELALTRSHAPSYTMVHKLSCHMARRGGGQPWETGDMPMERIKSLIRHENYRTCRTCFPFGRSTSYPGRHRSMRVRP